MSGRSSYYPEPGDWVVVEADIIATTSGGEAIEVKGGTVGRLVREEFDKKRGAGSQSAHDFITYVVDIHGVEIRFGFGEVAVTNPLDQIAREVNHE